MTAGEKNPHPHPVDICGTVVGESPDYLLLSGTVVGENPDHVCWALTDDPESGDKMPIINCICLSKLTPNNPGIIATEYQLSQIIKSQLMYPVNILFSLYPSFDTTSTIHVVYIIV